MTITLLGNSLSAGNLGIPYSRYLSINPNTRIINHGRDGDTLQGIQSRLNDALIADNPDVLVIQTGANDILLPEMSARGGSWTPFVKTMKDRGSVPTTNINKFAEIYSELIRTAISMNISSSRIICITIPPIGENLESNRNQIRSGYNRKIQNAAAEKGAALADVAEEFENLLKHLDIPSDWLFDKPEDFTADLRIVRRRKGAMSLSEERGLYLTMDGAHLNERGAELMGQVISRAIKPTSDHQLQTDSFDHSAWRDKPDCQLL